MHRRGFLQAAAGVAAAAGLHDVLAQVRPFPGMGGYSSGAFAMDLPLRAWTVLPNAATASGEFRASLTAAPFAATPSTLGTTQLWGYNGESPGPLVELVEGQRATFDFVNALPIETTVHWHGLPVPADQDGSPMDPVAPGGHRTYAFTLPAGSAGTYWYHPHAHQSTSTSVAHGLAAPLVVRSASDPLQGMPEATLMVTGLALDANGNVAAPGAIAVGARMMASGAMATLLVNGRRRPLHTMAPGGTERWRILNATADRYLRLALDGHRFAVVGTDGGLLAQPLLEQTEWLLAPAQRVEIVVAIASQPGARFVLRDLGYMSGMTGGAGNELMSVQTTTGPAVPAKALPVALRPFADPGTPVLRQRIVLSQGGMGMGGGMGMSGGMTGLFLINGKTFAMDRIDLSTVVGRIEVWDFVNATMMDHPMHVHGTQFAVVSRTVNGVAIPASYDAWLDTVNVPAGETVSVKIRQGLPGRRMVHCHILPHEDAGMMAVLDVRA